MSILLTPEHPLPASLHILKDCTWCRHRRSIKKAIQNRYEYETCSLTGKQCASPKESLLRTCERYQQIGCGCANCARSQS